jgi:hypothetical protein
VATQGRYLLRRGRSSLDTAEHRLEESRYVLIVRGCLATSRKRGARSGKGSATSTSYVLHRGRLPLSFTTP